VNKVTAISYREAHGIAAYIYNPQTKSFWRILQYVGIICGYKRAHQSKEKQSTDVQN
jgi:hypothetical protein